MKGVDKKGRAEGGKKGGGEKSQEKTKMITFGGKKPLQGEGGESGNPRSRGVPCQLGEKKPKRTGGGDGEAAQVEENPNVWLTVGRNVL